MSRSILMALATASQLVAFPLSISAADLALPAYDIMSVGDRPTAPAVGNAAPTLQVPLSYAGTIACVGGCPGMLRLVLNLHEKGLFVLRKDFGGSDQTAEYEIGRWSLSEDRKVLSLSADGGDEWHFNFYGTEILRLQELPGAEIHRRFGADLVRAEGLIRFEQAQPMRGRYRREGDLAGFTPCGLQHEFSVLHVGTDARLGEVYHLAGVAEGEPVKVRIAARIAHASMSDDSIDEVIVLEDYLGGQVDDCD